MMAVSNLVYRSALYDACDLNLAVSNGAVAPLWYNPSAVFLIAKFATEGTDTSLRVTEELLGLRPGDDLWNKVPWQRVLWSDDNDAAQIIAEAEKLLRFSSELREEIRSHANACDPWGKADGSLSGVWNGLHQGITRTELRQIINNRLLSLGPAKLALSSNPYSGKAWSMLAEEHFQLGETEDALRAAKHSIDLDDRYPRPYVIVSDCLYRLGQPDLAQRYRDMAQTL
jgi:tetratricopeptide (TPR) repeat protein